MKKKAITGILLLAIGILGSLMVGCSPQETKLTAYIGPSVKAPVSKLIETYQEQNSHITLESSYAGVPVLVETIRSLKQGDILIGTKSHIDDLEKDGLIVVKYYLTTITPVIIVRQDASPVSSWDDLAQDGVRIGLPNPELTSGGKIVKAVINKSPQADKISANITALASNPQGAIELLLNNEVDAILLPQEVDVAQLKVIDIPADINQAIEIWAAVLSYTVNENEAKAFVEFIIGEEGRKVFQEMGFQVAE